MGMSAEALNEIFRNSVNQAQECAKKTKDDGQKGIIYATLALAMANTGVVQLELGEAADLTPKAETKREDLKPKAATKKADKKAEPKEIHHGSEDAEQAVTKTKAEEKPAEKTEEKKVFGAEWTDEAVEYFKKQTDFIQDHQGRLYELYYNSAKEEGASDKDADASAQEQTMEFFNSEIERATVGACHNAEDINPMNIDYIVSFLEAVERGEEPKEGEYLPF